MAKRCPNCKSEISRYQEYCYQCGAEIKRASKRPKHQLGFDWGYFVLGLVFPPLGVLVFLINVSSKPGEAVSALIGSITSGIGWFLYGELRYYLFPEDYNMAEMIISFFKTNFYNI